MIETKIQTAIETVTDYALPVAVIAAALLMVIALVDWFRNGGRW